MLQTTRQQHICHVALLSHTPGIYFLLNTSMSYDILRQLLSILAYSRSFGKYRDKLKYINNSSEPLEFNGLDKDVNKIWNRQQIEKM